MREHDVQRGENDQEAVRTYLKDPAIAAEVEKLA